MTNNAAATYQSRHEWNPDRPRVLVVACSDGRFQENLDSFMLGHLGISRYDRLYTPGGPGALATSGVEYLRSDTFKRECQFLVEAHQLEDVFLIFHGPSEDGPDNALCADYKRIFPRMTAPEIRQQQESDMREILRDGFGWRQKVRIHIFWCEVTGAGKVQFVNATPHIMNSIGETPPSV